MTEKTPYVFSAKLLVGGLLKSDDDPDTILENLKTELTMLHGPEAFEIVDFREATDEEVSVIEEYLNNQNEEAPTIQ